MNKKQKLIQKLRTGLEPVESFDKFDGDVKQLTQNLRKKVEAESLGTVNDTLENFRSKIDLQPLLDSLEELKNNTSGIQKEVARTLEVKAKELFSSVENTLNSKAESALEAIRVEASNLFPSQIGGMKDDINSFQDSITDDVSNKDKSVRGEISKVLENLQKLEKEFEDKLSGVKTESGNSKSAVEEIRKEFEKLRTELMTIARNAGGGGNANRQIRVEGVDVLKKYTDINFVGATTSITTTVNETRKRVNIIFTGSAGGGGGISSVLAGTGITVDNTTPGTPIVNLGNTSVTAGTYGSDITVPRITIDAQGRISAASTVGITFPSVAGTPPGGANQQVQFNDGGSFGGSSVFTWNKNSSILQANLITSSVFLANRAVITDGSSVLSVSETSAAEIGFVKGVTSSVVSINNTQTLANKTLITPSIASFAQAQHNHQDGAGGSLLNGSSIFSMTGGQIKSSVLGTGTASSSTFLRGDLSWQTPSGSSVVQTVTISLSSVDILAMFAVPVQCIAGVAGQIPIIVDVVYAFTVGGTQYTGGGVVSLREETSGTIISDDGLSAAQVNGAVSIIKSRLMSDGVTRISGKGIFVSNSSGAFLTGTGTIKVYISYIMVTL